MPLLALDLMLLGPKYLIADPFMLKNDSLSIEWGQYTKATVNDDLWWWWWWWSVVQNVTVTTVSASAPCVPENIQNHLDCLAGVLNVTWQSSGHFSQFHASVTSSKGHISACMTEKHYCVVHNMQCETTYSVTVTARDEACNSSISPMKPVTTGNRSLALKHHSSSIFWW